MGENVARNRIVKPEFFTSEKLSSVSIFANLFFIGMLINCDDYGVCMNNNRRLIGDIFPLRENVSEKEIDQAKKELLKIGVIFSYKKDDKKYLIVKNWKEHQKVDRPSKRRFLNDNDLAEALKTLGECVGETVIETIAPKSENSSDTVDAPMLISNVNINVSKSKIPINDNLSKEEVKAIWIECFQEVSVARNFDSKLIDKDAANKKFESVYKSIIEKKIEKPNLYMKKIIETDFSKMIIRFE